MFKELTLKLSDSQCKKIFRLRITDGEKGVQLGCVRENKYLLGESNVFLTEFEFYRTGVQKKISTHFQGDWAGMYSECKKIYGGGQFILENVLTGDKQFLSGVLIKKKKKTIQDVYNDEFRKLYLGKKYSEMTDLILNDPRDFSKYFSISEKRKLKTELRKRNSLTYNKTAKKILEQKL